MTDTVFLLHGLGRSARSMRPLVEAVFGARMWAVNIGYDSRGGDLETIAAGLRSKIALHVDDPSDRDAKVHFITHSMGGLIARMILRQPPPNMGRLVMLGPPNRGSEIADLLSGWNLAHRVLGPSLVDLGTMRNRELVEQIGPPAYQVGIIAGTRSIDPVGWAVLPKPNDGRVSVAATRLEGAAHITLPTTHALMMRNREVRHRAMRFLQTGQFV